jgi:hypothetical protein
MYPARGDKSPGLQFRSEALYLRLLLPIGDLITPVFLDFIGHITAADTISVR